MKSKYLDVDPSLNTASEIYRLLDLNDGIKYLPGCIYIVANKIIVGEDTEVVYIPCKYKHYIVTLE